VPYAVELSVRVLGNDESFPQQVHRIVVRKGALITHSYQIEQTTYTFDNKSADEYVLFLEHPRRGGKWKLFESAEPVELTDSYWRFRVVLPPKKATSIVVKEQTSTQSSFGLTDVTEPQLQFWTDHEYVDGPTERVLRKVLDLQQQANACRAAIAAIEKERDAIHREQTRIRENLQSLGDRSSEKDLRERFVRTLNAQEDRLAELDKETRAKTREADECRERINAILGELKYEAAV
jgi:hypothetical protein